MSIKLCTLNVKGLAGKNKRIQVFEWLKQNKFNLCFLQELHCTSENYNLWQNEWKDYLFLSGNKSNSLGIGILCNNLPCNSFEHHDIIPGRLQTLRFTIQETSYYLINVYGYNQDDTSLFNTLNTIIMENNDNTFIIGGDFNTIVNPLLDKKNGNLNAHKQGSKRINELLIDNELIDVWRIKNPDTKMYTWHSNTNPPIFCRLDYFFVSNNIVNAVSDWSISYGFKTDHSVVSMVLDIVVTKRGSGSFKIINSIHLETDYQQKIKEAIRDVTNINQDANPGTLVELIKGTIRNTSIKYSSEKRKTHNELKNEHSNKIQKLRKYLENSHSYNDNNIVSYLENAKHQRTEILDTELKGILIRSKAEYIEGAEKNTKFFANLEKTRTSKVIKKLETENGTLTKNDDLQKYTKNYYSDLYNCDHTILDNDDFLTLIILNSMIMNTKYSSDKLVKQNVKKQSKHEKQQNYSGKTLKNSI